MQSNESWNVTRVRFRAKMSKAAFSRTGGQCNKGRLPAEMSKIIAIANHKGGVGKTSSSLNLAHTLAADGKTTVLLCDLDPKASLSKLLRIDTQTPALTLYDLLIPSPTSAPVRPEHF